MIPVAEQQVHSINEVDAEYVMGITKDPLSAARLMMAMSKLYSNPFHAFVQEYSTNAWDSHVMAGHVLPIAVTLPSYEHPFFTVQDWGLGLSQDEFRDVFGQYGESTKTHTNDVTGMLGLGCKSAFAYAHCVSFTVISVQAGIKTVAVVARTDAGGTIRILDTCATDEHDGVTVSIPVRQQDFYRVRSAADQVFSYWRDRNVLIDGEPPAQQHDGDDVVWVDPDIAVIRGGKSHVVMGGVAYPFESDFEHGILAYVPIGSVDFTPSREELQDSELTADTIGDVKNYVKARFPVALKARLDGAATPWERVLIASEWKSVGVAKAYLAVDALLKPTRPHLEYGGRRSRRRYDRQLYLSDFISQRTIITDFPTKGLSTVQRKRLSEYGIGSAIILPDGTDVSVLEGREKVISWDTIVAATPHVEAVKAAKRVKGIYTYVFRGHERTGELDLSRPVAYALKGDGGAHYSYAIPECQVVVIYSRQLAGLQKVVPGILREYEYFTERCEEVRAQLTDDDLIALTSVPEVFQKLAGHSADILDPDFGRALNMEQSEAVRAARKLGFHIPDTDFYGRLLVSYPLLNSMETYYLRRNGGAIEGLVTYINATYTALPTH